MTLQEAEDLARAALRDGVEPPAVAAWVADAEGRRTWLTAPWPSLGSEERWEDWAAHAHPEDRAAARDALPAGTHHLPFRLEYRLRGPDGAWRWAIDAGAPRRAADGTFLGYAGSLIDDEARRRAEERVRGLALRDPLTGLPNRRMLRELLARELAQAGREGSRLALLLVDLDDFKQVNDTLGHSAGDELLLEVARRLRMGVREGDHVARLGGDEFAVLAVGAQEADAFGSLARRLVAAFATPFAVAGAEARTGASIGVAIWPDDGENAEALLGRADLALYAAKEAGRGTWRFFRPAMQARAEALVAFARDLHKALERGELALHYQPVVDLADLRPRAFEALLRWQHPERGLVPPSALLPAAERNRLIVPLSQWVTAEALRHAAAWRADGLGDVPVAVNLTAQALAADGFAEHVADRLQLEDLPGSALLVEVAEGAVADDRKVVTALEELRSVGVRVAIDDFGTGCSSLARLRDLPLDLLKIDGTFLVTPCPKGEAILRAVVELGRSLGLPVAVEGVETESHLALARRVGAGWAQGYLFARPMPATRVTAWAQAWAGRQGRIG